MLHLTSTASKMVWPHLCAPHSSVVPVLFHSNAYIVVCLLPVSLVHNKQALSTACAVVQLVVDPNMYMTGFSSESGWARAMHLRLSFGLLFWGLSCYQLWNAGDCG